MEREGEGLCVVVGDDDDGASSGSEELMVIIYLCSVGRVFIICVLMDVVCWFMLVP